MSVNTNYNKFGGISCYADRINYANINYDGNVYKCTAQDYTSETALGFLDENGQIRWDKEKTQGIDKQAFLIIRFVLIVNIWLYVEVLVFMLGGNVLGIKIILNVRTKRQTRYRSSSFYTGVLSWSFEEKIL